MVELARNRVIQPCRVGAFGKVPSAGDFVQMGPSDGVIAEFRGWLGEAVPWAADRGSAWKAAFTGGGPQAFIITGQSRAETLAGLMQPSGDAVGRAFPLCVYCTVQREGTGTAPWWLPIVITTWLQPAIRVLQEAASFPPNLEPLMAVLETPSLTLWETVERSYAQWKRENEAAAAFSSMLGGSGSATFALDLLHALALPWRGQPRPSSGLSLRAPVLELGVYGVSLWAELLHRVANWDDPVLSLFWSADMRAHVGMPHPRAFAELWLPDPSDDTVCALGDPGGSATGSLPPGVVESLTRPGCTLERFLDDVSLHAAAFAQQGAQKHR